MAQLKVAGRFRAAIALSTRSLSRPQRRNSQLRRICKPEIIRQERVPGFEGTIFTSPVAAECKIYLVNAAGKIAIIAAVRRWQHLKINDLEKNRHATPALVEGMILVHSEHSVWALPRTMKGTAQLQPTDSSPFMQVFKTRLKDSLRQRLAALRRRSAVYGSGPART